MTTQYDAIVIGTGQAGAAILGLSGDEAVHSLLDVMYARQPYTVISRAVHIHPTLTELIPTVLQDHQPLQLSAAGGH